MTDVLFDTRQFLNSLAGDQELALELLQAFLQDSPQRTTELGNALAADDAASASKLAHSLKGMCGVVRAERLTEIALRMEHLSKNARLDEVRALYEQFVESHQRAVKEMQAYLER